MNWEHVEAQWEKVKGKFHEKWGHLTNDDLEVIRGKKDRLVGKLRQRYADQKDNIENDVERFIEKLN